MRRAIARFLSDELSEEEFIEQVKGIICDFRRRLPMKLLCQDIGLIVREREHSPLGRHDKFERIWISLDRVEPRIRGALVDWERAMAK